MVKKNSLLLFILHIGCENESITTAVDNVENMELNSGTDLSLQQIIAQKILEKTNTTIHLVYHLT